MRMFYYVRKGDTNFPTLSHQDILPRHIYLLFSSTWQWTLATCAAHLISSHLVTSFASCICLGIQMQDGHKLTANKRQTHSIPKAEFTLAARNTFFLYLIFSHIIEEKCALYEPAARVLNSLFKLKFPAILRTALVNYHRRHPHKPHSPRVSAPAFILYLILMRFRQLATATRLKSDKSHNRPSMMKVHTTPSPTLYFILLLLILLPSCPHTTALTTNQEEALLLPNQTVVPQSTTTTSSLSVLGRLLLRYRHLIHARSPVETPPTEYLPYPPPPNYSWPPGTSPATENPQPSESDPAPGSYTDAGVGSDGGSNGQAALTSQAGRMTPSSLWGWSFPTRVLSRR